MGGTAGSWLMAAILIMAALPGTEGTEPTAITATAVTVPRRITVLTVRPLATMATRLMVITTQALPTRTPGEVPRATPPTVPMEAFIRQAAGTAMSPGKAITMEPAALLGEARPTMAARVLANTLPAAPLQAASTGEVPPADGDTTMVGLRGLPVTAAGAACTPAGFPGAVSTGASADS